MFADHTMSVDMTMLGDPRTPLHDSSSVPYVSTLMTDDVTYPTIVSTDLWGGICCFSTESDFVLLGSHGPIPQVLGWTELRMDWACAACPHALPRAVSNPIRLFRCGSKHNPKRDKTVPNVYIVG